MFDTSVIIPARGEEKWIGSYALDSLLNQTYKNFEIIVVNDPSVKDKTAEVIESYKNRFKKLGIGIRLIDQPEKRLGPGGARNVGVENSKVYGNPLIVFLDADVKASPNAVETTVMLSKYDVVGLGCPIHLESSSFRPYKFAYEIGNKMSHLSIKIGRAELRNLCAYREMDILDEKWDEGRITNEDHSASKRMAERGRILWVPTICGIASSRRMDKWGLAKSTYVYAHATLKAKVLHKGVSMDNMYVDER